jgi:hypothetical protein
LRMLRALSFIGTPFGSAGLRIAQGHTNER